MFYCLLCTYIELFNVPNLIIFYYHEIIHLHLFITVLFQCISRKEDHKRYDRSKCPVFQGKLINKLD